MVLRNGVGRLAAPLRAAVLAVRGPPLRAPPATAHSARVAEVVSPADNNGGLGLLGFLSPNGDRVGYTSTGTFAGAPELGERMTYVAHRSPSGWATEPVVTAAATPLLAIADSSSRALWQTAKVNDAQDVTANTADLFVRDGAGPITRITLGSLNSSGVTATFAAADAELDDIFFETPAALEPPDDTRTAGVGLYEWQGGGLTNVTVPVAEAAKRGVVLGGGPSRTRTNALSSDGSQVVLTSPSSPSATVRSALWT